MWGVLWFDFGPGSDSGEDGEGQVERPRSRSEQANQRVCYPVA